jgi:hypothetical protein
VSSPSCFKFWIAWSLGWMWFLLFQAAVGHTVAAWLSWVRWGAIGLHAVMVVLWANDWRPDSEAKARQVFDASARGR